MELPKAFPASGWMYKWQATRTMLQHSTPPLEAQERPWARCKQTSRAAFQQNWCWADRTDVPWPALGGPAGGLPKNQAFVAPSLVRSWLFLKQVRLSSHLCVFAPVVSSTWRAPSSDSSHLILSVYGITEWPPGPRHPKAQRDVVSSLNPLCFPHSLHTTCHYAMCLTVVCLCPPLECEFLVTMILFYYCDLSST